MRKEYFCPVPYDLPSISHLHFIMILSCEDVSSAVQSDSIGRGPDTEGGEGSVAQIVYTSDEVGLRNKRLLNADPA